MCKNQNAFFVVVVGMLACGLAFAQPTDGVNADKSTVEKGSTDKKPKTTAEAKPKTSEYNKAATPTSPKKSVVRKPVDTSASDAALEELRYKHLWIAYGLIWLIIFIFMLRTYGVGRENRETLDALKSRLAQLEKKDG